MTVEPTPADRREQAMNVLDTCISILRFTNNFMHDELDGVDLLITKDVKAIENRIRQLRLSVELRNVDKQLGLTREKAQKLVAQRADIVNMMETLNAEAK